MKCETVENEMEMMREPFQLSFDYDSRLWEEKDEKVLEGIIWVFLLCTHTYALFQSFSKGKKRRGSNIRKKRKGGKENDMENRRS